MLPADEPQTKRRCGPRKLERFCDRIERGDHAWHWAKILSILLGDYPKLIRVEDYQPILRMLSDLQSKIKYSVQAKVFNDLVGTLVAEEARLKVNSTGTILDSFCTEHWHKIMQMALKSCATSNEIAVQNVELLRIMIENGYIVSHAFIETIAREILSNTIKKSTTSVCLMIALFHNVNMDVLMSGDKIKASVINWLSPKVDASELKRIIGSEADIDIALVAELYVLCILSKTNKSNKLSFENVQRMHCDGSSFDVIIANMRRQFSYQLFDRIMAIDCSRDVDRATAQKWSSSLPEANTIDVVMNEKLYAELERSLNPDDNFQPSPNAMDDFTIIASSLNTYVNILNQFVVYNAFDHAKFEKSFLCKRIAIKITQLSSIMDRLAGCDEKDQFDVVEKMNAIWKFGLHPLLEQLIFERDCNGRLIDWLARQLRTGSGSSQLPLKRLTFADLSSARKMQSKCLMLLARFSTYDDENGQRALQALEDYEYDTKSSEDLFNMFEVVPVSVSNA